MEERYCSKLTVGLILEKDNKVLLIRRKNTGYMDGMYGFLAGHVEEGESFRQALARETYEEGKIIVKEEELEYVCAIRSKERNYINFFFRTDKYEGIPVINEPDKCDEIRWIDINNLPENMIPNDKRAIYNYLNKIYLDEYNY